MVGKTSGVWIATQILGREEFFTDALLSDKY